MTKISPIHTKEKDINKMSPKELDKYFDELKFLEAYFIRALEELNPEINKVYKRIINGELI